MLEFNREYKNLRAEESKVEREHDAILLDYALRKEKEQLDAEEVSTFIYILTDPCMCTCMCIYLSIYVGAYLVYVLYSLR